jgi:nitric oxide reductase subunit C
MLSKSAARKFFIVGTVLCSGAFVLLTIDTVGRVPDQTRRAELTESAINGKHLFDRNNCMGCHTIFGEGAYYAPELTKVFERRGPDFISAMLRDPQKMYPGERKMQKYDFTEQEISDLVAFFKWIGGVDLNGFPPKPDLIGPAQATMTAHTQTTPPPPIFNQMCTACHALGGAGGTAGPALDGIGDRRDEDYITRWLKDPMAVKADSRMPKLPLSDENIKALATFLSGLKKNPNPTEAQ